MNVNDLPGNIFSGPKLKLTVFFGS